MSRAGHIVHGDQVIEFEMRPGTARRRHLQLRMGATGRLVVVTPRRASPAAVQAALQDMAPRVARFLVGARRRLSETPPLAYAPGEKHWFRGRPYALAVSAGARRARVRLEAERLQVSVAEPSPTAVRDALRAWYRAEAAVRFAGRLEAIGARAPWVSAPPPLKLRRMRRTWGSCSSKGSVLLNTHLVKAPDALADYVIAHELCHLVEMNHGPAFYRLLDGLEPGWKALRARLKAEGHRWLNE
jgi:predicted metal-dependent hydrolase